MDDNHSLPTGSMKPGTYLLLMPCTEIATIQVGRLGSACLKPGYYLYAGSALGAGGVAGRLRHHLKRSSSPHWHIDYLRHRLPIERVWYSTDGFNHEHDWFQLLQRWRCARVPIPGFGASDCGCASHLTYLPYRPSLATFRRKARQHNTSQSPVRLFQPHLD